MLELSSPKLERPRYHQFVEVSSSDSELWALDGLCPTFFQDFNDKMVSDDAGRAIAKTNRIQLNQTGMGLHFVEGLQGAASKWRLAKSVTGLSYEIGSDVSEPLAGSYSAQARNSLSVIALEAFARIFSGKDWPYAQGIVFTKHDSTLCSDTRAFLNTGDTFVRLHAPSSPSQKRRLDDFHSGGNDVELYPVCVAIRNAFAHGAIGGRSELVALAPQLQAFILDGIQQFCVGLSK